jgi:ArsR family transcriptional regulator
MESNYQDQVRMLKAFCDETRLQVLELLRSGEKCACALLEKLDCGQSGLSYHMKILVESGIVESRTVGKWTYYRISEEGSVSAVALIKELAAPAAIMEESISCGI